MAPKDTPLRKKLTWLAMTCSVVALVTTATALGVYEWVFYRRTVVSQIVTLSSITARNSSAALAFVNPDDAMRVLNALDTEPSVRRAALYDADGKLFSQYYRETETEAFPEKAPPDGQRSFSERFQVVVPVAESKRFGTLLVEADLRALKDRLGAYVGVLLATTSISGLLAYLLAAQLKTRITEPVHALVKAASRVQTDDDYNVRVSKRENDELGALTEAFNGMLERIQKNQTELRDSEERLRLALEAGQIGTWEWDVSTSFVTWDARTREIFGVPANQPITIDVFYSLLHPEDRERVTTLLKRAVDNLAIYTTEYRVVTPAGATKFVAARGLVVGGEKERPRRVVGAAIDITERRRAELRVAESEQRFRVLAEKAPVLIWSCDASLKRDYFNRTWLAFTGRAPEQELGDGWREAVPADDLARWIAVASAAAAQNDPYSIEYRLRRADGATRWVVETASPRLAADGAFAGYLGTCADITARKESEAELESHVKLRTRQLELANQELESFSYSVSHDLRSPVRVIQGFTDMALEEVEANRAREAIEPLRRVIKAAKRMDDLISAFITLARISRAELHHERVDLTRMTQEIVSSLRLMDEKRQVEVEIEPNLSCVGDERLLRVAMENLLGNAWKFTAGRAPARIEVGRLRRGDSPCFYVRDNGAGFNEAFAHKLFQVFQRLHNTSQFEGLGVGLNTVHRIIQRHNGRVWAEGREGEGATFYFIVPDVS